MFSTLPRGRGRLSLVLLALLTGVLLGASSWFLVPWWQAGGATAREEVASVLDEQVEAWNEGDLDRFLWTYWDDDHLTFYSGGTINQGLKAVAARYRKNYQSGGKEMGRLSFSDLDVTILSRERALARARWKLVTKKETINGLFTLVLRKFPEGWKIVHDHTSRAEPK